MLSRENNELICRVGPGTAMGKAFRRFWVPALLSEELPAPDCDPRRVQLLGEDFVAFRDSEGKVGVLDEYCCHRSASLALGRVEAGGIRCIYHGWKFAVDGTVLETPNVADPTFKDRFKARAYPVREAGGLVWVYLGPRPAPQLPDWDRFHSRGFKQVAISEVPCNWFQCQENSIDPVHFEWLHDNWSRVLRGQDGSRAPAHRRLGFDEFDYGFVYRRVREDTTEDDELWTTGRVCLWPNCLYTGHFEWRVPIDDEHTLSVGWFIDELPGETPFEQEEIPCWHAPFKDERTGRWIDSHVMNQDFIAWVGQGAIADRSMEHLGESDRGVILMRKRLLEDVDNVAAGRDPMGVIRDPAVNHSVYLPIIGGLSRPAPKDGPRPFPFLAGQPEEVTKDFEQAWRTCAAAAEKLTAGG